MSEDLPDLTLVSVSIQPIHLELPRIHLARGTDLLELPRYLFRYYTILEDSRRYTLDRSYTYRRYLIITNENSFSSELPVIIAVLRCRGISLS